jgi:glycosyltransferase involved in cell wall biosynthesis
MCKRADAVVGVADAVGEELDKYWGIKGVKTIHNGIDTRIFNKKKETIFDNKEKFHILYVGSIIPRKGLEYLFEAIDSLENTIVHIIGNPSGPSKKYLDIILSKVKNKDRIIVEGKIPNKELPKYYSDADCFVLPTISEGLPKVVLEAMACECPVITTNVSGNPEVVNNKTGYLIEAKNANQLKETIKEIQDNKSEARKRAKNAKKIVENNFTWKEAAKKYALLYKSLI